MAHRFTQKQAKAKNGRVIPAQAGIQFLGQKQMLAFLDTRLRGYDIGVFISGYIATQTSARE